MTTPTGAADERERLITLMSNRCPEGCRCSLQQAANMLRADAETMAATDKLAASMCVKYAAACEQLAAQSAELATVKDGMQCAVRVATERGEEILRLSAELERVRKDAERYRWLRQRMCIRFEEAMNGQKRPAFNMRIGHAFVDSKQILQPNNIDAERVDSSIDAALAAPSAAGGYKE